MRRTAKPSKIVLLLIIVPAKQLETTRKIDVSPERRYAIESCLTTTKGGRAGEEKTKRIAAKAKVFSFDLKT